MLSSVSKKIVQGLILSRYIKEQEKESVDHFLETKAGKWSSEVSICLMNPSETHIKL